MGSCSTAALSSNKIGINGTSPLAAQENVISGNLGDGVCIVGDGTTQNCVSGNYIGTDEMASTEVPNGADGVCITGGASTNTIGGISQMAGNVIANNEGNGVSIDGSNSNYVQDNWIGTDASASMSIGNGRNGVLITDGAQSSVIGGNLTGAGNVIANNVGDGVTIAGSGSTTVDGNWIGTDQNSDLTIGNWGDGVDVTAGSAYNAIGTYGTGNVIADNYEDGIAIDTSSDTTVQANCIGTDKNSKVGMGNDGNGIKITNCNSGLNTIGGSVAFEGSIIVQQRPQRRLHR